MAHPWDQDGYDVRFDWGPEAAKRQAAAGSVLVLVDVLSFTTTTTLAVERGTAVYPVPWRDARAKEFAERHGAALAVDRSEVTPERSWSLSPASMVTGPAPERLVLPSPNGAAIASAVAASGRPLLAASLRNVAAVARSVRNHLLRSHRAVAVIAAGERWPDGSLRPALEDLLGAGAVISALAASEALTLSPEAAAARNTFEGAPSIADAVSRCASALELIERGFAQDVDIAVEENVSHAVAVLTDGLFVGQDRPVHR
jgi:2-phosphosulfolactate phosphatase